MKKKLDKFLNNKNIKIIIPIIVLIVLLIVVFIYLREYKYSQYRNKQEHSFYQYYAGLKLEYDATISFNRDNEIKGFEPKEYKITYDSIPIYYKEQEKVIFPNEMSIIFPLRNYRQNKLKEFSYMERINNINYITFEDYRKNLDHYIIFNGNNLYFFSDSVNLTINGESITLSPMSYIIARNDEFSYYNYETDEYKTLEINQEVFVSNDYYKINVTNDYIDATNDRILLINDIQELSVLKEEEKK